MQGFGVVIHNGFTIISKFFWVLANGTLQLQVGPFQLSFPLAQTKGAARGGWRGSSPSLSNQNIDVYFLSFSPTL